MKSLLRYAKIFPSLEPCFFLGCFGQVINEDAVPHACRIADPCHLESDASPVITDDVIGCGIEVIRMNKRRALRESYQESGREYVTVLEEIILLSFTLKRHLNSEMVVIGSAGVLYPQVGTGSSGRKP